jgi:hypothetical protein
MVAEPAPRLQLTRHSAVVRRKGTQLDSPSRDCERSLGRRESTPLASPNCATAAVRGVPLPSAEGAALPGLGVSGFEIDAHGFLDLAQPQR